MGVERQILYEIVCDQCGRGDGTYYDSPAAAVIGLDDDFWTARDDVVSCQWCVDYDIEIACGKRPEGHRWDTPTNKRIADLWTEDDNGSESRIRYCGDCSMMQRQIRGGKWFGYDRRGNWLGDD